MPDHTSFSRRITFAVQMVHHAVTTPAGVAAMPVAAMGGVRAVVISVAIPGPEPMQAQVFPETPAVAAEIRIDAMNVRLVLTAIVVQLSLIR